jgi:TRAP-type C4-dicarboxylate transport system substrate-binding protein
MRFLAKAVGGAIVAASLAAVLPATAQTKWDMPTGYPVSNPHTVTLQQLAKDIEFETKGALRIVVHPNGSLFRAPEIARAVETGQAQMGEILMSLLVNQNPLFGLDSLPFLASSFDDSYRLYQAQKPALERVLEKRGVKLLYAVAWPPQGIYAKKELRSAADMKGLKWRAYNPATSKIAQSVGAQPMTIQADHDLGRHRRGLEDLGEPDPLPPRQRLAAEEHAGGQPQGIRQARQGHAGHRGAPGRRGREEGLGPDAGL